MIEAILAFFAFPIVFWILFCSMLVWLFVDTVYEETGRAFWPALFGGVLAYIKFDSVGEFFSYLWNHPFDIVLLVLVYMFIGTVWSLFKWYLYVQDLVKNDTTKKYKPELGHHKSKITSWIILWIPSMIVFVLNDPIRRLAHWIYDRMSGLYQAITDRAYAAK